MCDTPDTAAGSGWRGWNTSDASREPRTVGEWVDLSWPLSPDVPRLAVFPAPRITSVASIPDQPLNITELSMIVHVGTHVDAPRHFFADGPGLDDVPLSRLMGSGVVWKLDVDLDGMIDADQLERMRPTVEPGDIVVLVTGIERHVGTPSYDRHAALSVAAADWLVEKRVKLVALDVPTPEVPTYRRGDGFDWPVHHILLGDGVLVAEQAANAERLSGGHAEFLFLPLNIVGGDGAPARVLARPVTI